MSIKSEILELIQIVLNAEETPKPESYTDILKTYLSNEKNSVQILTEVIYSLKELLIDMAQLVVEEVTSGSGQDLINDSQNDILLYISRLNEVIKVFEDYLEENLEKDEESIREKEEALLPKMAIFSNSAINELKSIPDEEKAGFSVPIGYIKNGGAKLNVGVKIITTTGGCRRILEYRNPTGQARVFAYKITKNLIYVVKIMLKKGGWSKLINKSLGEKKPSREYSAKVRQKLGTREGLEELRKKSEKQLEDVLKIIGVNELEEGEKDVHLEAICVINELLQTNLSLEYLEGGSVDESTIYERLYSTLEEIENTEELEMKYLKITKMEDIMLEVLKNYVNAKNERNWEEDQFLKTCKIVDAGSLAEMNRRILISERRIMYMLNYLRESIEELKTVEKKIVLTR